MKIGFISLGCPKNQLDTEVMLHEVASAGYEITPDETEADIVIINTCAFIESAKKEAIDNILDIAWLKKHKSLKAIIVTGCMAERYGREILDEFPEVDAVLGVGSIHNIVEAIESCVANFGKKRKKGAPDCRYYSHEDKNTVRLGGDRVLTTPDYAAYLKISEGCDNRCTYCAIPDIRGKFRSRPMDELVAEARELDEMGIKELTVIAQDTTRYGKDLYGEYCLDKLLHRITEETNIPWIRVLYCYPDKMTDGLIEEMKNNPRILNYIDLPLQHISDNVLRRMNRHGKSAEIRKLLTKLRREIPNVVIRTTFIVGFPGETEEDFCELCEFVKEQKFARVGVFTYSREEGTPAASFPDQIDEQVKQDRMDILMRSQIDISEQYLHSHVGKAINVICEDYDTVSDCYFGRSEGDAPEIDGKVFFESEQKIEPGEFVKVKVRRVLDYDMYGFAMKKA